jgi:hypothetical protein
MHDFHSTDTTVSRFGLQIVVSILMVLLVFSCTTSSGELFSTVSSSGAVPKDNDSTVQDSPALDGVDQGSQEQEAVTQGSGVQERAESDTGGVKPPLSPEAETTQPQTSKPDESPGIHVKTDPKGATVFLDGDYVGRSPVFITDPGTGMYSVRIEKDGWYPESYRIAYDTGSIHTVDIDLEKITGFLHVETIPEDSQVFLDLSPLSSGITELPVGRYLVSVRKFGYEGYSTSVRIVPRYTTTVTAELQEAEFGLHGLTSTRKIFSPANAGELGATRITFEVTDYGSGSVKIYDSTGSEIYSDQLPRFTTWNQEFRWTGLDSDGHQVPDGEYRIRITGIGETDNRVVESETSVTIDSSVVLRYRSLVSGTSGALFAPEPMTLPPFAFQITTMLIGHADPETHTARVPLHGSARFSPYAGLEIDAQGTLFIHGEDTYPFSAGVSVKYRFTSANLPVFAAAVALKGTYYRGDSVDSFSNYAGGSFSVPVSFAVGPLTFILTPEVTISPVPIEYYEEAEPSSVYAWGYGRVGVLLDIGPFSAGFSGALRTQPFHEGFWIELPFQAGAEAHLLIPGTQIVLSAYCTGEFDPLMKSWYLMGGGGVGFIH